MKRGSDMQAIRSPENRIDELCDAYESCWQRDERPQIGSFLEPGGPAYRARLFRELLLVELEYRRRQSECPTAEEYRRDFPEFSGEIEAINLQFGAAGFATITGADEDTVRTLEHIKGERVGSFELM